MQVRGWRNGDGKGWGVSLHAGFGREVHPALSCLSLDVPYQVALCHFPNMRALCTHL